MSQIEGLLNVIDSGATIDANGDTITQEYINENASREIKAVEKLQTKCMTYQNTTSTLGLKLMKRIGRR